MKQSTQSIQDYNWLTSHRFMTFDPGVHTGWALFDDSVIPMDTGLFSVVSGKAINEETVLKNLGLQFESVVCRFSPEFTVIENAEFRESRKGRVSAASGALGLLQKIIGGYVMISDNPILIRAQMWKGNMDDTAVDQRVVRSIEREYRRHETEAVGIGLAIFGRL